jgi:hypothetical protein
MFNGLIIKIEGGCSMEKRDLAKIIADQMREIGFGKVTIKEPQIIEDAWDGIFFEDESVVIEIVEPQIQAPKCSSCGHATHIARSCPDESFNGFSCRCGR